MPYVTANPINRDHRHRRRHHHHPHRLRPDHLMLKLKTVRMSVAPQDQIPLNRDIRVATNENEL